jgi:hypothetical protein
MSRSELSILALLAACGPLPVVDARGGEKVDAMPSRAAAIRSDNEGLTAVALYSRGPLSPELGAIEVAGTDGVYSPIAAYDGDEAAVAAGVRRALIVPELLDRVFWRLVPALGRGTLSAGGTEVKPGRFDFRAAFSQDNSLLTVTIADPFAALEGGRIERAYHLTVAGAEITTRALSTTVSISALDPSGRVRVAAATDRVSLAADVYAHPLVERVAATLPYRYVESRVIVVPIFDVDIPVLSRCEAFEALVLETIGEAAKRASPGAELRPTVKEASDCRPLGATFSTFSLSQALGESLGDPTVVPLLVLVSNAAMLSASNLQVIADARQIVAQAGGRLEAVVLGNGPFAASPGTFLAEDAWTYAFDPELPARLDALVSKAVPFRRYVHSIAELMPVRDSFDGVVAMRLCSLTEGVVLFPARAEGVVPPPGGPLHASMAKVTDFLPAFAFGAGTAQVVMELCRAYCGPRPEASWFDAGGCAR